ncbi:MAG: hypothetical protein JWR02_1233 [Mucilaginibacter sp.]|nr:hypothetical protein [Mucilaginibacter sp.]
MGDTHLNGYRYMYITMRTSQDVTGDMVGNQRFWKRVLSVAQINAEIIAIGIIFSMLNYWLIFTIFEPC